MYSNTGNERGQRHNPNAAIDPHLPASQMPLTYGQSAASGPAPTTAGHHKHDFLNKIDPGVDSTRDNQPLPPQHRSNVPEGTYGPHRSRIANALDPRVDSDLDSSTVANAMDPRVDSDADRHRRGMAGGHGGYGAVGSGVPEGTYGPHSTRAGNAMDPRVDSDADRHGRRGMGGMGTGVGATATANLPGPAPNTAGPHRSDLLNKLDPRVDSKGGMTYRETERRGL
ncbi:hypothetical protein B0T21DRAFT_340768 [Apiosordaria backusii]|uniref:Uncharacterized protein n=1 Tax=Apiosordaria backusii TaxID=314023 RepID=A0AA40A759_9PEZI|nr:hypothetical protein B0T21DRAFT_340768 [Apiosordaria backusii]